MDLVQRTLVGVTLEKCTVPGAELEGRFHAEKGSVWVDDKAPAPKKPAVTYTLRAAASRP